jgi:CheY-like chemotaxis protein
MEPLNILLVEDNPDHAELVKLSLEDHNVLNRIVHLIDGEQALDYMFAKGDYQGRTDLIKPNLILLDLRMPKVDGLEVLKVLKANESTRSIPVVILTTSKNELDLAKAYEYHANSYLVKPVDFDNLTKLIKELGFYWLALNEKPL